jgi:hypothetical protein
MPGVGFAERYVMARESNVVRVDFARRPDPPTPRFPGAGALRPATRRIAAMDQDEPQARSAPSPLAGEGGQRGWLECSVVLAAPLPVPPPQAGTGTMGHRPWCFSESGWARPQSDFGGLAIHLRPVRHGQERRKRPCGLPCFRSRSSSPSP